MDLNEDGSMQIEESIEVNFSEARHGIYREIPLGDNNDYLTIDNITSNNNINALSSNNNILSIQLWDPDRTVIGNQHYSISYMVKNAIKTFSWNDELAWNIVWWQRNTTIDRTTWTINLPQSTTFSSGAFFAVWWYQGEQRTGDIKFYQTTPTQRRGELNQQLQSQQWVTVWLQFSWDYFTLPNNYDNYFINTNTQNNNQNNNNINEDSSFNWYGSWFAWLIIVLILANTILKRIFFRKSKQPIITQYEPPQNIDPSYAFYLWYNNKYEPKIFTALLYYWATSGRVTIKKQKTDGILSWFGKKETYNIIETSLKPQWTSTIDDMLLQQFFGLYDNIIDQVSLSESSYIKIEKLTDTLEQSFKKQWLTQKKSGFRGSLGMKELTSEWSEIFEHLRGYKEYLSKVEQPVIEQELKANPDFINKILPWAVLFGVETRLLKMMEEVLKNIQWYQANDGTYLTAHTFSTMNKSFATYSVPPRSSGSSSFGGGGGFSWWGRGGWWWGSW